MKLLRNILLVLGVLAALLVAGGFLLPAKIHVERSTVIAASAAAVFGLVNDFRQFNRWSPWAELDPSTRYAFEGPPSGVGARMLWQSDDSNIGSGSQEIIESVPDRLVRTHLDFGPQGVATASYRLEPVETGTKITWALDADAGNNLPMRYFGLFFDRLVGADYERGLARLRALAEGTAQPSG